MKTLKEELDEKRGLVLRNKSELGSTVSIHIQTPNKVFDDPVPTRHYVDVFKKPMLEALELLDNEEA